MKRRVNTIRKVDKQEAAYKLACELEDKLDQLKEERENMPEDAREDIDWEIKDLEEKVESAWGVWYYYEECGLRRQYYASV